MNRKWLSFQAAAFAALAVVITPPTTATADTYQVGPTRTYKNLGEVEGLLNPGDVVEVDGDVTYRAVKFTRSGTATNPIVIRGIRVNGNRPIIAGDIDERFRNTVQFELSNHYVFENFEVTGGSFRCVFVHAGHITIRDTLVRDCPAQGILGADQNAGWLTLDRVEVTRSGGGTQDHPIYVSSDPFVYPGAVFRMQHSYVHDANGGNAVKSRAERNEIYYNWIEGAHYRELELIGIDATIMDDPPPRPMHSDVVGNVLIKGPGRDAAVVRVGHDGQGEFGSHGRFRFVNNVFITNVNYTTIFQPFGRLESIEAHNNVFYKRGGQGALRMVTERLGDVEWVAGRQIVGTNNWIMNPNETIEIPETFTGSIFGSDPGFMNVEANDFRPAPGSPLVDAGTVSTPQSDPAFPFPSPLYPPAFHPPLHAVEPTPTARPINGTIDIGAFESNAGPWCSYALSPSSVTVAATAGTATFTVITTPDCPWLAASQSRWITVTNGRSGFGTGTIQFSVAASRSPQERVGRLTVGGQTFFVTQEPGSTSGALADIYINETDVTFFGGDGPLAAVTNDGVDGSLGLTFTELALWASTPRLHLPVAADMSAVQATDRLQISLDLGESGPGYNQIHIYFNNDWQSEVIAPDIDGVSGYQTWTLDISAIRERLGDEVNDIYFKAGNGFPANGTLKVDNIKFIRP